MKTGLINLAACAVKEDPELCKTKTPEQLARDAKVNNVHYINDNEFEMGDTWYKLSQYGNNYEIKANKQTNLFISVLELIANLLPTSCTTIEEPQPTLTSIGSEYTQEDAVVYNDPADAVDLPETPVHYDGGNDRDGGRVRNDLPKHNEPDILIEQDIEQADTIITPGDINQPDITQQDTQNEVDAGSTEEIDDPAPDVMIAQDVAPDVPSAKDIPSSTPDIQPDIQDTATLQPDGAPDAKDTGPDMPSIDIQNELPSPPSEVPVKLAISSGIKCFITDKQNLYCWGNNDVGQIGVGTYSDPIKVPTKIGLSSATDVSVYKDNICAIVSGGQLYCWGENNEGNVGVVGQQTYSVPTKVALMYPIQSVSVSSHTCATDILGALYCWGHNIEGNKPTMSIKNTLIPILNTQIKDVAAVGNYFDRTCVLTKSQEIYCWGSGAPFGDGTNNQYQANPTKIPQSDGANSIRVGMYSAFQKNGEMYRWGSNIYKFPLPNITDYDVGYGSYYMITGPDNQLFVGGQNNFYQLGTGDAKILASFKQNPYLKNALTVVSTEDIDTQTCAIGTDNKLYCWGGGTTKIPTEVPTGL